MWYYKNNTYIYSLHWPNFISLCSCSTKLQPIVKKTVSLGFVKKGQNSLPYSHIIEHKIVWFHATEHKGLPRDVHTLYLGLTKTPLAHHNINWLLS